MITTPNSYHFGQGLKLLYRGSRRSCKALFVVAFLFCGTCAFSDVQGSPRNKAAETKVKHDSTLPTTITSDTLKLRSKERKFTYLGNVVMVQGTMKLTCNELQGSYTENNEIEELTALGDVVITKGEELEARGERADFDNEKQIVIMSENPSVLKGKSQLNADLIKVYLETEQTVAEGRVQMKIVQDKESK